MCIIKCFLRLLFVLCLLLVFMSLSSFCYASVTEDYIEYGINNLIDNGVDFYNGDVDYTSTIKSFLTNNFISTPTGITQLTGWINDGLSSYNLDDLEDRNIIIFVIPYSTTVFYLYVIGSNVSAPNNHEDLGYLYLYNDQINTWGSTDKIYYHRITVQSSSIANGTPHYQHKDWLSFVSLGQTSLNADISVYSSTNVICAQLPSIYLNYNGSNYPVILMNTYGNYYPVSTQPSGDIIPSGDVIPSGDNGNGTFTPDYTNQLDNINSNISNSTQTIVNTISGETYKIISNQNENQKTLLSSILSFSGDSVMNDVNGIMDIEFDFANTVKDYQTRFFKGSPSGDLVFSWNGITLFDTALIPSGDFNISAMIRENEQLGRLHHIIQVFSISSFGIILIAGYWNLFLSTIGAGSYFLMESTNETEALEDNASVDEFSYSIDEYNHKQKVAVRDSYYKELVAKTRAEMLRKAGRK